MMTRRTLLASLIEAPVAAAVPVRSAAVDVPCRYGMASIPPPPTWWVASNPGMDFGPWRERYCARPFNEFRKHHLGEWVEST